MQREELRGEVVLTSKTQSPEELLKVAESLGYPSASVEQVDEPIPQEGIPTAEDTPTGEEEVVATEEVTPEPEVEPEPVAAEPAAAAETEQQRLSRRQRAIKRRDGEIATLKAANDANAKELAELKKKLENPPARSEQQASPAKPPVEAQDPEPKIDDVDEQGNLKYNDYTEHTKALSKWAYRDEQRRQKAETAQAEARKQSEDAVKAQEDAKKIAERSKQNADERWERSTQAAKEEFADFDQVMMTAPANIPQVLLDAVMDRDESARVAYWLTKHPEEDKKLRGIAKLGADATMAEQRRAYARIDRELDRIEALLPTVARAEDPEEFEEEPAPVAPPRAAAPPPRVAPKPTPPRTVTGRQNIATKTVNELSRAGREADLRQIDGSEYRKKLRAEGRAGV